MASLDHLKLTEFIKSVHQILREDAKHIGSDKAWIKHCQNEEQLKTYASAMKELATNHWELNMKEDKILSRINWVFDKSIEYFIKGNILHHRHKEQTIASKIGIPLNTKCEIEDYKIGKLKLLDVGSCYNPFKSFTCFDVYPIDIAPSVKDVYKCDFLKVPVLKTSVNILDHNVITLQENFFHIIVFSLLLEYLPTPEYRLQCCKKAYRLLKHEGILFIITPDSKHVGANAKYMKSWRHVLAKLGLSRIKYEKLPYIHCMAFRKNLNIKTSVRWAELHENEKLFDKIYIPQDFNTLSVVPHKNVHKLSSTANDNLSLLQNLPNFMEIN